MMIVWTGNLLSIHHHPNQNCKKLDDALDQSPANENWRLESRTHGKFKDFKPAWPLRRSSSLIWKICLPIGVKEIGVEVSCPTIIIMPKVTLSLFWMYCQKHAVHNVLHGLLCGTSKTWRFLASFNLTYCCCALVSHFSAMMVYCRCYVSSRPRGFHLI